MTYPIWNTTLTPPKSIKSAKNSRHIYIILLTTLASVGTIVIFSKPGQTSNSARWSLTNTSTNHTDETSGNYTSGTISAYRHSNTRTNEQQLPCLHAYLENKFHVILVNDPEKCSSFQYYPESKNVVLQGYHTENMPNLCWTAVKPNPGDQFDTIKLEPCAKSNDPRHTSQKFEIDENDGLTRVFGSDPSTCLSTIGRADNESKLKNGPCLRDIFGNFENGLIDENDQIKPFGSEKGCIMADSLELRNNELIRHELDCNGTDFELTSWGYDDESGQIHSKSNRGICFGIDNLNENGQHKIRLEECEEGSFTQSFFYDFNGVVSMRYHGVGGDSFEQTVNAKLCMQSYGRNQLQNE